jgi:4,5-dihydroxyphthalate decarboxylase
VPVNHMVTVRAELARSRPDLILELVRLFRETNAAAPARTDARDPYPFGTTALQPAITLALRYTAEQGLLPRPLDIADIWEGLPAGLE